MSSHKICITCPDGTEFRFSLEGEHELPEGHIFNDTSEEAVVSSALYALTDKIEELLGGNYVVSETW